MDLKLNEEVKHGKLERIYKLENQIKEYKSVFGKISESTVIKLTKNITSQTFSVILFCLIGIFVLLGLLCFFPTEIKVLLQHYGMWDVRNQNGISIQQQEEMYYFVFAFFKYVFLFIATFFITVKILLKKNLQKRNTIFSLSKLVEEVIGSLENIHSEEKRKYEYFIDSLSTEPNNTTQKQDTEDRKTNPTPTEETERDSFTL